ncbi:MAG: hypothetical protein PHX30_04375 [Candidatus Pacebacteria bacterium]|nr:hypothetical protein [Candidatus Paceibacterota bacterium]
MDILKFLEEINAIKDKLYQEVGEKHENLSFPFLVRELLESKRLDEQMAVDLRELWKTRNEVVSSRNAVKEISSSTQVVLARTINNLNQN